MDIAKTIQQGIQAHQSGELDKAKMLYERVLKKKPKELTARYYFSLLQTASGNYKEAYALMKPVVDTQSHDADVLYNFGVIQLGLNQYDLAYKTFQKAININPHYFQAVNNAGLCLFEKALYEESLEPFRRAIELNGNYVEAWLNMANSLSKLERYEEAKTYAQRAYELAPLDARVSIANGNIYSETQFSHAIEWYKKALDLDPGNQMALRNIARSYRKNCEYSQAIACYEKLYINPDSQDLAVEHLSLLNLRHGRFLEGARFYISRNHNWKYVPDEALPDVLSGSEPLLIRGEQGLGDEIFFLRFIPKLRALCDRPIMYQGDARVHGLLAGLELFDEILPSDDQSDMYQSIYVGDLPFFVWREAGVNLPGPLHLMPETARLEDIRQRLEAVGPPPYIALTWRAGIKGKDMLYKEMPLMALGAVMAKHKATYVAVQRLPEDGEMEELRSSSGCEVYDFSSLNDSLEDMLCLMQLVDDYIGVSNTNIHLRASLHLPAKILMPSPPEWRWMEEGSSSPWFPDFRVYRQAHGGDWSSAFKELSQDMSLTRNE